MKERFLPIGTVCTLNGINKKIMITGFFGVSYTGMIKMYDYVGYEYPEGMLLQNRSYLFNHEDIEKIDFIGYETNEHEIMNNNLLSKNVAETKVEANGIFSNFKFDENGVVIFDGNIQNVSPIEEEKPKNISNPFNEIYIKDIPVKEKNDNSIFNNFKFDENGIVISEEQPSEISGFKFDENGFVVADETVSSESVVPEFNYDENGFVIEDKTVSSETVESSFKFDENGIVIAEEQLNQIEEYRFDGNGFVIADDTVSSESAVSEFKFDENGVVISE